MTQPAIGMIAWTDLTVPNADAIRDFYAEVTGWNPEGVSMGEYSDFTMNAPGSGEPTAGICHARGANAGLPPQWLIYVVVENLDHSLTRALELGGKVVTPPRNMGDQGRFAVIRDPAGAVAALYEVP